MATFAIGSTGGDTAASTASHPRFTPVNSALRGCRLRFARIQKEKCEALH
jgi:hypothetical protein